jgi:hypothetical protein
MNSSKLGLVPLQQASLCMDCEMITAAHTHCCACGSAALLSLARTLNGRSDFNSAAATFAPLASFSGRRFESHPRFGTHATRSRAGATEYLPFPALSADTPTKTHDARGRHSLRHVTAVLHHAMSVTLAGIRALGPAAHVRPGSLASSANAQAEIHSQGAMRVMARSGSNLFPA